MKWNKIIITKWNIYSYQKALNQDYVFAASEINTSFIAQV
jgi:hypothetical protein